MEGWKCGFTASRAAADTTPIVRSAEGVALQNPRRQERSDALIYQTQPAPFNVLAAPDPPILLRRANARLQQPFHTSPSHA
jgi:hypothetical protein